jgi:hypothetical protein
MTDHTPAVQALTDRNVKLSQEFGNLRVQFAKLDAKFGRLSVVEYRKNLALQSIIEACQFYPGLAQRIKQVAQNALDPGERKDEVETKVTTEQGEQILESPT